MYQELIPERPNDDYKRLHDVFKHWYNTKSGCKNVTQDACSSHFASIHSIYSKGSLYKKWSCVKKLLKVHDNVNADENGAVKEILKQYTRGYTASSAPKFSEDQIAKFYTSKGDESNYHYKIEKIALSCGLNGRLRAQDYPAHYHDHTDENGQHLYCKILCMCVCPFCSERRQGRNSSLCVLVENALLKHVLFALTLLLDKVARTRHEL